MIVLLIRRYTGPARSVMKRPWLLLLLKLN